MRYMISEDASPPTKRENEQLSGKRERERRGAGKLLLGTEFLWGHDENFLNYKVIETQFLY